MPAPAAGKRSHELGGEDLLAIGDRTQPCRLHHGRAEEVGGVLVRLPGGHAHPDVQPLT